MIRVIRRINETFQMRPVVVGHLPREAFFERNGGLVSNLTDQFMRGLRPGSAKQGSGRSEIANQEYLSLPYKLLKLHHFFKDDIERMINKNIAGCHSGLDDRRESPCVRLCLFVNPQNRGIRTSLMDSGLNPRDGLFVNKIVSSIKPVYMGQQYNLLAWLDFGTLIEQVIDSDRSPFWDSLLGGHDEKPSCAKRIGPSIAVNENIRFLNDSLCPMFILT
jgi:hypothetical protein